MNAAGRERVGLRKKERKKERAILLTIFFVKKKKNMVSLSLSLLDHALDPVVDVAVRVPELLLYFVSSFFVSSFIF
jgi:hypothetical protein